MTDIFFILELISQDSQDPYLMEPDIEGWQQTHDRNHW